MLLPKGATVTPEHITELLERMELDKTTYQIGKTKVNIPYHIRFFLILTHHGPVYHNEDESNIAMVGNLLHPLVTLFL